MEFLQWMTNGNVWLWFHILAALIYTALMFNYGDKLNSSFSSTRFIMTSLIVLALGWELYELFTAGTGVYGSQGRWLADSIGDVVGAIIASGVYLWQRVK